MAKDSKAVKEMDLEWLGPCSFQPGSRNHQGAKELKSNGDGDTCSLYILYISSDRKKMNFLIK